MFPTPYCAVLSRRKRVGADAHGNDLFETVSDKIPVISYTETSVEREDTDGNSYTCTVKIFLPPCVKGIRPRDVLTFDGEHVYIVREFPKQYHSPWRGAPLWGKAPKVVYGVRQVT